MRISTGVQTCALPISRNACLAYGWMRPSKLRLPDNTAVAYRSRSMISCWISGSSAPDMPLQVVQAKATPPKPNCYSSLVRPDSSRYRATVFDPGARDDLTHGLRVRHRRFDLAARQTATNTTPSVLVVVPLELR